MQDLMRAEGECQNTNTEILAASTQSLSDPRPRGEKGMPQMRFLTTILTGSYSPSHAISLAIKY
jgi:hypothetical protein